MPTRPGSLLAILKDFNGNNPDSARAFAAANPITEATTGILFKHLAPPNPPNAQAGAAWLIWEYANVHKWSPDDRLEPIVNAIPIVTDWQARLCLLQTLSLSNIPKGLTSKTYKAIHPCAYDENTFVRAWAIGGLIHLAGQHPRYRRHVLPIVVEAQETSKASVKARIRNALKDAGWTIED